jgi:hypothetical protein
MVLVARADGLGRGGRFLRAERLTHRRERLPRRKQRDQQNAGDPSTQPAHVSSI